jgi:P4 family phage/plasmid primase-like protien
MNQGRAFDYEPDKLAEAFLTQYYVWHPQEDSPPEQYVDRKLADWKLRWWRGGFYDWHNGRYMQVDESEMSSLVVGFLQDLNRPKFGYNPPDPAIKITAALVRNILLNISGVTGVYVPDWRELNSWIPTKSDYEETDVEEAVKSCRRPEGEVTISFLNGLLMFGDSSGEAEFVKHTPKYFSLARLPYNYDKDAQCPRWREFLDDVMAGDDERIELLQQWAGYLLTNTLKFQKFMLLSGEGGNGKTVFTTIMEKMVGEENASHVPLCRFDDRFALAATLNKMLNTSSESSHRIDELCETMLKSYTSGDRMTFDRKNRDLVSARPTAKVMISTNQLPNFTDKSNGIWRRMLFVPFDKSVPIDEQNPELVKELAGEMPGIFNWAYKGLCKLAEAGQFVEPTRCKEAINEYRKDTNPAKIFLEENYVDGFEFEGVPCGEMYQSYVAWCNQNGYHPLNASNFGKEVKRAFPNTTNAQKTHRGQRIRIYNGLSAIDGSEVATSTLTNSCSGGSGIF